MPLGILEMNGVGEGAGGGGGMSVGPAEWMRVEPEKCFCANVIVSLGSCG